MNLAETLRDSAARSGDTTAVRTATGTVSYQDLDGRVDQAAAAMRSAGVMPGDRVALLLGNTADFVVSCYGAWRAGAVVVPVNVTLTPGEVAHVLTDAGASLVIVGAAYHRSVAALRGQLPDVRQVVVVGDAPTSDLGMVSWQAFLDRRADPDVAVPRTADDLALLAYTSGTTGEPRGAMLTHGQLRANQEQMAATPIALRDGDVVLCVLPLFHIYALNVGMGLALATGATLLLLERFDPVGVLEEIERHRATVVLGAPPMYVAWANLPAASEHDLSSIRFAVSGAAALPPPVLAAMREQVGIVVWEGYGLTEAGPAVTTNALLPEPVAGCVGVPLPDVDVRITDPAGGPAEEGEPGLVQVRSPAVFAGYWNDPASTAAVLREDGWLDTGDIGYLDGGRLFLVDRAKDLIIVSGFNVYPREVEEALLRHPGIVQAAAVGVPHPYTGEAVKAVVVPAPDADLTADDVIAHAEAHLARFKCPSSVEFVEALPVLPTGKVRRRFLRQE